MSTLILLLLLSPMVVYGQSPSCPTNFVQLGSKCYFYATTPKVYADAITACSALGAKLAEPKSTTETTMLANYFAPQGISTYTSNYPGGFWMGMHDQATVFSFVYTSTNTPITYSNWEAGQPDNYGGGERCVHMIYRTPHQLNGQWNDYICGFALNYVCEAPTQKSCYEKCCNPPATTLFVEQLDSIPQRS